VSYCGKECQLAHWPVHKNFFSSTPCLAPN
jgi:hypothetical protein